MVGPEVIASLKVSVRARWVDRNVYVRKADLLAWFDAEATALRDNGYREAAQQTTYLADDLRKVRAS